MYQNILSKTVLESTKRSTLLLAVLMAAFVSFVRPLDCRAQRPDSLALGAILGESVAGQNASEIIRRSLLIPEQQRLEMLSEWVLPSSTHQNFRLFGATPTESSTPNAVESPALELVSLANNLGKLDEVAKRVESHQATTTLHSNISGRQT